MNARLTGIAIVLATVLQGGLAGAEIFRVTGRVMCPAYLENVGGKQVIDPTYDDANRTWVPCAGVLVKIMDSDPTWDDYCGAGYTDSEGRLDAFGSCYDTVGGPPDIYLSVQARTETGVVVGVHGWNWFDYALAGGAALALGGMALDPSGWWYGELKGLGYDFMTSNEVFSWLRQAVDPMPGHAGATLAFGTFKIGTKSSKKSQKIGMALAGGRFAMQAIKRSGYRPKSLRITVNNMFVGAPTTVWNTVQMKNDYDLDHWPGGRMQMWAIPHEAAHATYNRYHSDWAHYFNFDMMKYIHTHDSCSQYSLRFAWYEGFAEWVSDYAYSAYRDEMTASGGRTKSDHYEKVQRCPSDHGYDIEGNVNGILNELFYGDFRTASSYRHALRLNENVWVLAQDSDGNTTKFAAPALRDVFHFAAHAPSSHHGFGWFWNDEIHPYCLAPSDPIEVNGVMIPLPRYCSSKTFLDRLDHIGPLP